MAERRSKLKYFSLSLLVFLVFIAVSEFAAGSIYNLFYNRQTATTIRTPYQYFDRSLQIIRNITYNIPASQVLESISKNEGPDRYSQYMNLYRSIYGDSSVSDFNINSAGLKGPEIIPRYTRHHYRVLILGDSNTLGPPIDQLSYPRILEHLLNDRFQSRYRFEVLNGGFSGCSVFKMNRMLDQLLLFEPDYVIISLGWNGSIIRGDPSRNEFLYFHSNIYRLGYHLLQAKRPRSEPFYSLDNDTISIYSSPSFSYDMREYRRMLDRITRHVDKENVFIMTIPCLYTTACEPCNEDIESARPLDFTDNLAAYAVLTSNFNNLLNKLAYDYGVGLIDLASYSEDNFKPRSSYFRDVIHLEPLAFPKIASFIFDSILIKSPTE